MALALELYRSIPRYLAAKAVSGHLPGLVAGPLAPLRLVTRSDPEPPGEGWVRIKPLLAGICGSDLATVSGKSSFYFSPLVSLPFVLGHEVVGELAEDAGDLPAGSRVVLDPVLSCATRGLEPCPSCVSGHTSRCDRITSGHVSPGLQTGYCADTGGGWSRSMAAHRAQLHAVPEGLPDERAVLIEPLACAIHAVLRAGVEPDSDVLLIGAGTVGVLSLIALREFATPGRLTVVAKHPKQRVLAERLGADEVVSPGEAVGAIRRSTRSIRLRPERGAPFLLGGADVTMDCAGSRRSLDLALRTTRAGGRVVLGGIPAGGADLTPVWFRELEIVGAYASGMETPADGERRSAFDLATDLASRAPLDGIVGAIYPLNRWREAVDHALAAGRLGTVKVAFDPRK